MTRADLVERVTDKLKEKYGSAITKKDVSEIVNVFLESMIEALKGGHNIEIRGFGSFKTKIRKRRLARNPRTGEPVEVPPKSVPVFKPSKKLRAEIK